MKAEFILNRLNGQIAVCNLATGVSIPFTPAHALADLLYNAIRSQLPGAFDALLIKHKGNKFEMLRNFIFCNLIGNDTKIDFDTNTLILNLEERFCCASKTGDCQYAGIICSPQRLILTPREKEIVDMVKEGLKTGKKTQQIARELNISFNTFKNHCRNILKKNHKTSFAQILTL